MQAASRLGNRGAGRKSAARKVLRAPQHESAAGLIESAAPGVDVAELIARVRQRVAEVREAPAGYVPLDALEIRASVVIDSVEAHANIADQKSQIRTQWPSHIGDSFPFGFGLVRHAALSLLAFLFKDQRHVNAALVAAFRDQISLNRQLIEQVRQLRNELEAIVDTQR